MAKNSKMNSPNNLKMDIFFGAMLFLLSFSLYLKTLAPSLYFGDSGELAAAAFNLGIAHPPGYPLYLLLGKFAMWVVPLGDMAYRMNLLSAFFASIAIVVIYRMGRMIFSGFLIPIMVAGIFSFSATFWSQAVITEVYTLSLLFFSLIVLFSFYLECAEKKHLLIYFSMIIGFALTHHITILLFLPVILFYVFAFNKGLLKNKKRLMKSLLFLLLPLLLYLYLPIRSALDPPNDWGNPETFRSVLDHITARQFSAKFFANGIEGIYFHFKEFMRVLINQLPLPFLGMALIGLIYGLKRERKTVLYLLMMLMINVGYSCAYSITDIEAYFIPSFLIYTLFIGFSFSFLVEYIRQLPKNYLQYGGYFLLIGLSISPIFHNFSRSDQSQNNLARNYGMNIINSLGKEGVLFVDDDETLFLLSYLTIVEGMRPDVEIYDLKQNIFFIPEVKAEGGDKRGLTLSHINKFQMEMVFQSPKPIYFTNRIFENFRYVDYGLLFKAVKKNGEVNESSDPWQNYNLKGLHPQNGFHDAPSKVMAGKYFFAEARYKLRKREVKAAEELLEKSIDVAGDQAIILKLIGSFYLENRKLEKAEPLIMAAIKYNPFNDDTYNMLGMIAHYQNQHAKALSHYIKSLSIRKNNVPTLLNRSVLYEQMGDKERKAGERKKYYEKAAEDLRTANTFEPLNFQVKMNQTRLFKKLSGGK